MMSDAKLSLAVAVTIASTSVYLHTGGVPDARQLDLSVGWLADQATIARLAAYVDPMPRLYRPQAVPIGLRLKLSELPPRVRPLEARELSTVFGGCAYTTFTCRGEGKGNCCVGKCVNGVCST